jgi:hypothetical protein
VRYILRIWWPRTISNRGLWQLPGQTDINMQMRKRKFRWIGLTLRKEDEQPSELTLQGNPQGNSWRRYSLREAGRSWCELRCLAADRDKWEKLVDDLGS